VKRPSRPQTVASSSQAAHPKMEELIDYYRKRLDSTAAARVRGHLADCRECTALVLDLEDFVQAESSPPMPEEITEARLVARAVTWEARAEKLRKAGLMAASLFLAISVPLGIYVWNHGLRETPEVAFLAPEVNLPLLSLYPRSALRGVRENRLEVPAGTRWVHVVLTTDDLPPAAGYQLVIVDAAGREILSLDGLRPTPVGTFSIGLPAARVPAGAYELRLFRQTAGKKALVHEYPLEIVATEGAGPQATAGQEPN
jgi:anti-sigma factor RsiW